MNGKLDSDMEHPPLKLPCACAHFSVACPLAGVLMLTIVCMYAVRGAWWW